jgi:hypothetical protein
MQTSYNPSFIVADIVGKLAFVCCSFIGDADVVASDNIELVLFTFDWRRRFVVDGNDIRYAASISRLHNGQ